MGLTGSVQRPQVLLLKDGVDIGQRLAEHLVSVEYIDAIDNEVDGLVLTFSKMFAAPKSGDKLTVSIGFGLILDYVGEFYVSGWTERPHDGIMIVWLTPVDFYKTLKQRRTQGYDNVTLDTLLQIIASRHGLLVKNDLKDIAYVHKAQTNESDLRFMHRLAQEHYATFAIKNGTIIFKPKSLDEDRSSLPKVFMSVSDISDLSIEYQDKTHYVSGVAKFRDHSSNQTLSIQVGEGEPQLVIEGSFKNTAEAKARLQAALNKENSGRVHGYFVATTQAVIAGSILTLQLQDRIESDLQITEVRHTIDRNGYTKDVTFSK